MLLPVNNNISLVTSYGANQSWKKGCSTVAMLPEGNIQNYFWQEDLGQLYNICRLILANCYQFCYISAHFD